MMKKAILGLAASFTIASVIPGIAETIVREVEVTVDMASIQNEKAAAHWATLADDLENAIIAGLVGKTGEEGAKVLVDIDEVELANTYQELTGVAESRLVGDVAVTHDSDNTKFDAYKLTVTFEEASPFVPEGIDLAKVTTDSHEYYDAMVKAFADHIVRKLG
ncbi:MAG: hypothetical protein WBC03_03160 [Albidovulum sp.]|jgi:hypothetical protein|uniref:hypothetical protein n=1 Tax=Albidovulum sp. TaxID=1872424 RepID=UPI001D21AF77|nr:hypothetical protein [Paracoccaceae bacterium]